jgi:amidase
MATHHFRPDHYHNTLGSHEPVLRIAAGDTVVTTTADAWGFDADRDLVATRSNPQTGPFYLEGAEPGDTLVLSLVHLAPNRSYGFSSAQVAPNVVDPAYVPELSRLANGQRPLAEWDVDVSAGTATLVAPETRLGRLTLPLAPMLGCFGVAPAGGQAISTATSGTHGGNMDYRGFVSGVTVYLPVFVSGALIFVGDGHAVQGDRNLLRRAVHCRPAQGEAHRLAAWRE